MEERKAREHGQVQPELRQRAYGQGRGRKGEEEGEGGTDWWDPGVSDSQEKEKEKGRWAVAGKG
jgi:hypothetical protein